MKFLNFSLLLILISCGSQPTRRDIEEDAPYRTSGLEQFFLPELPAWANNSASGRCFKKQNYQYLDFAKMGEAYSLKYPELIELQAQYNERLESYFRSTAIRFVKPVEEAAFFSNTLEQVRGGVRSFKLPNNVKEVEVIWLDGFIADDKIAELKTMARNGRFDEKLPIAFSACLSKHELNQWLIENDLDQEGFYSFTSEWLSPYDSSLTLKAGLRLELQKMIGQNIKINFLKSNEKISPTEIVL